MAIRNKKEKSFVIFLRLESLDRYITDFDLCKYVVLFKEAISDILSGILAVRNYKLGKFVTLCFSFGCVNVYWCCGF